MALKCPCLIVGHFLLFISDYTIKVLRVVATRTGATSGLINFAPTGESDSMSSLIKGGASGIKT